jgi:hypothetical protein
MCFYVILEDMEVQNISGLLNQKDNLKYLTLLEQ